MTVPPLPAAKLHRLSVWQLVTSVIGLVLTLFSIVGIAILALIANSSSEFSSIDTSSLSKFIWPLVLAALLTLPSIILSIRRISGKNSAPIWIQNRELLIASALVLVWVGCLWLGYQAKAGIFLTLSVLWQVWAWSPFQSRSG
jgi:uncharacterized membrane protein